MKGVKEMKALLDILELDSSVYVRIQVKLYGLFCKFPKITIIWIRTQSRLNFVLQNLLLRFMVFKIKNHHVEILLRLFFLFCANAATFFSEVDTRLTGFIHEIPFPAPLSLTAMWRWCRRFSHLLSRLLEPLATWNGTTHEFFEV